MLREEEKKQYVATLERLIEGTDEILRMPPTDVVTPEMRTKLQDLQGKARTLLPKVRKGEFEIAVVGLEKSGKSTLSNALIGLTALPTADERCTYTSTCIRPQEDGVEQETADITFYTEEELKRDFREKLEEIGIPHSEQYSFDTMDKSEYESLFSAVDESKQKLYKKSLNQDILDMIDFRNELRQHIGQSPKHFVGDEVASDDFRSYITAPGRAIAVKDVVIHSTQLRSMPEAVVFDVPGFNSPTKMHLEQTLEKMSNADAIVMVARADEPSITGDVLDAFEGQMDQDDLYLSDKLFLFANRADLATDLDRNKAQTYEQWVQKWHFIPESRANRIVFGSANAHLGDKVPKGVEARAKLESIGVPDGIETLRGKLQEYYATERFQILKKRINHLVQDVVDVFQDAQGRFAPDSVFDVGEARNKLVLDLDSKLRDALAKSLEDLRDDINRAASSKHPLASQIAQQIANGITTDAYGLSNQTIADAHKHVAGIGQAEQPAKVDLLLREQRFREMYGAFTKSVLGTTNAGHEDVQRQIIDAFMEAMHIAPGSRLYKDLSDQLSEMYALDAISGEEYYDSLVVRFARDLFEIQIKFGRQDRVLKFREKPEMFLSMAVFYNASHAGTPAEFAAVTPESSPMWRILLQPGKEDSAAKTAPAAQQQPSAPPQSAAQPDPALVNRLLAQAGQANVDTSDAEVQKLIGELARRDPQHAAQVIAEILQKQPPQAGAKQRTRLMKWMLGEKLNTEGSASQQQSAAPAPAAQQSQPAAQAASQPPISLQDILEGKVPERSRDDAYTYAVVQREFADDIEALRGVLLDAFVPAVDMDTVFRARASQLIEDIIASLDEESFREFLARNASRIRESEMRQISEREAQQETLIQTMATINEILDDIAGRSSAGK